MVDIDRMNIFIHAAQTLNFSETAKFFHVSQPTISKNIQDLEKELGVPLFHRMGGKLHLTDTGQSLLPWAHRLIHLSNEVEKIARSSEDEVSRTGKNRLYNIFRQIYPSTFSCTLQAKISTGSPEYSCLYSGGCGFPPAG